MYKTYVNIVETKGSKSPQLDTSGVDQFDQRLTWRADMASELYGASDTVQPAGLYGLCLNARMRHRALRDFGWFVSELP